MQEQLFQEGRVVSQAVSSEILCQERLTNSETSTPSATTIKPNIDTDPFQELGLQNTDRKSTIDSVRYVFGECFLYLRHFSSHGRGTLHFYHLMTCCWIPFCLTSWHGKRYESSFTHANIVSNIHSNISWKCSMRLENVCFT